MYRGKYFDSPGAVSRDLHDEPKFPVLFVSERVGADPNQIGHAGCAAKRAGDVAHISADSRKIPCDCRLYVLDQHPSARQLFNLRVRQTAADFHPDP
jgi:hypothetical protein